MRTATFLTSFLLATVLASGGLVRLLNWADIQYARVNVDVALHLDRSFQMAEEVPPSLFRVAYLADSLSLGPGGFQEPSTMVHSWLNTLLHQNVKTRGKVSIAPLISSGVTVYSHYFMADRTIAIKPDLALIEFNLFWLSPAWHARLDRTVLAGWLPATWWPEAVSLPLHRVGLTTDRLLLYRGLSTLKLYDAWRALQREQARVIRGYRQLGVWLQERSKHPTGLQYRVIHAIGSMAKLHDRHHRATPYSAKNFHGAAMRDIDAEQFALVMLDALLARLHQARINLIVYIPPHNIEHLQTLGLFDREQLDLTLDQIAAVTARHDGRFVDLHDTLPDEGFRDYVDHFAETPQWHGSQIVARKLLPAILGDFARRDGAIP